MPPVSFNQVPANLRIPFVFAEFSNEGAVQGASNQPFRTLMIGQKLAGGSQAAQTRVLVTSAEEAKTLFGAGSQIAKMAEAYFKANTVNELHCVALDDNVAGVAADGSLLIGGAPTKAGVFKFYIAGKVAEVAVATTDTAAAIASNLQAVIAGDSDFVVSAVVNGVTAEQLDFTAKNKGENGNDIDLRMNYFSGDSLPEGVTATITAMQNGAGNPDVDDAIAAVGDDQYLIWVSPYYDASNLTKLEAELADRFGPLKQNDGYHLTGSRGTLSTLNALGDSRNSQFTLIKRCSGPTSPADQMSSLAGVVSRAGELDPARPFQTLELPGVLAESESERLTLEERNILLFHGVSTDKVDAGGSVRIERLITTYKENPAGAADISYLDLNTLLTLSYLRYDFRNFWLNKYPRHKLANDGTQFGAGQAVMTPKVAKSEAIIRFRIWEELGLVEDIDQFKNDLIVERNSSDPNRLDFFLPPNIINQLRVVGVKIGFLL